MQHLHNGEKATRRLRKENTRLSASLAQTQSNLLEEKQRVVSFRSNSKNRTRRNRLEGSIGLAGLRDRRRVPETERSASSEDTFRDMESLHRKFLDTYSQRHDSQSSSHVSSIMSKL
ncbi:MAG: hypothetical protein KVP17_003225 [Porospora cf. gigantea B]|nr:MAG: hypothetical protein KVP17_003225 [Porospora cf. gigantea B]